MALTKNADKFCCHVYKMYLERTKNNAPLADTFDDSEVPLFSETEIVRIKEELRKNDFISTDITGKFYIRDGLLIYMENRFKNGLVEITDFIAKLIP